MYQLLTLPPAAVSGANGGVSSSCCVFCHLQFCLVLYTNAYDVTNLGLARKMYMRKVETTHCLMSLYTQFRIIRFIFQSIPSFVFNEGKEVDLFPACGFQRTPLAVAIDRISFDLYQGKNRKNRRHDKDFPGGEIL